jgi:hypothetical protein
MSEDYDIKAVLINACEKQGVRLHESDIRDSHTISHHNKVMILRGPAAELVKGILKCGGSGGASG